MFTSHLLKLHDIDCTMYEIKRHLRPEGDGDAVVVAFSTSKQLKASYSRRWSTQQSYGKGPGLYHTEVRSTESWTCSVPPTAVLLVQERGIYTPTSIKVAPVRIIMDNPCLKAYCAIW